MIADNMARFICFHPVGTDLSVVMIIIVKTSLLYELCRYQAGFIAVPGYNTAKMGWQGMKHTFLPLLLLVLSVFLPAGESMAAMDQLLSIGPKGVEAIAISPNAIDIYVSSSHPDVCVSRNGEVIGSISSGERKLRDEGLKPNMSYTYRISSLGDDPVEVSERTFPILLESADYDVVVVGATASGTAAAMAAARLGSSVALIEETNKIGGMASNGLGSTDIRDISRSNGFFEEFREHVVDYYGSGNGLRYEPRVANAIMKSLVYSEPNITLFRHSCAVGVLKDACRVCGVEVLDLTSGCRGTIRAKITIDATVEGDVAAAAGVSFRIPREARSNVEPHAGVIYYDNDNDEILPGSTGEADHRVQSYAYLLTVKDYGEDRTIPKPPNYSPEDYRYSPQWEESWANTSGRLPNGKFEINQHPWGIDLPGINYSYPNGTPEERERIVELYRWRALGYLYYIQTELGQNTLGLAEDEYPDNCYLPHTMYVREARRMIGRDSMNESDVTCAREMYYPNSIAIGDYPMDSHATQPPVSPESRDRGEGEWWLVRYTPWYRVPFGVVIPENTQGLLVSTAVSATHVAYGTLRMEPVRMSLGQVAGTLAAMAVRFCVEPGQVPYPIVQNNLLSEKAYLTWFSDVDKDTRHFKAIQFLGVRGFFNSEEFRPDENLTVDEAKWLMERLLTIERCGVGVPPGKEPPQGGEPITRSQLAELLVNTKRQVDPVWACEAVPVSHYADLARGTSVSEYAETLYRHHIETSTWEGPPSFSDGCKLFHPNDPITRADAAQAIWLAHCAVALRFD